MASRVRMPELSAQGYFPVNRRNTPTDTPFGYPAPAMKTKQQERGERIRTARKAVGFTQVSLAQKIGIAQSAISDLERGESVEMDATTLLGLTRALGVRPEWIMWGELPMRFTDEDALILLQQYGQLSDQNKAALLAAAEALLKAQRGALPPGSGTYPLLPKPPH